jgi:LytR cell envelope-related transcriptional attenuator
MIAKLTNFIILSLLLFITGSLAHAQESITLSISPTLFDISAEPGQSWQSNLRVVNVNKYDLTVYVEVVNFAPRGEGGDGRFIPIIDGSTDNATLAEWFSITSEPVVVPAEQTKEVPFTVSVPKDASPGGHFAAILVGTRPIDKKDGESRIQTAQMVASLFFAKVAGDVIESGSIREFTTAKTYLETPEVTFSLRFENKGNVHLQPQGEIKIFNMWGHERGILPINQHSNFGNVLPESIRKFVLTWKGEWSISEFGRYRAVATLGYGTDARQFTSSETYFWVIPYKLIAGIIFGLLFFFLTISWLVRLYIRHVLAMAGINVDEARVKMTVATNGTQPKQKRGARLKFHAPIEAGILDLSNRLENSSNFRSSLKTIMLFIKQYRLFFAGLGLFILFLGIIIWYLINANTEHRPYEVVYNNNESTTLRTSEDILYEQLLRSSAISPDSLIINSNLPAVAIVNRSGVQGVGAQSKLNLQKLGYSITKLEADFNSIQKKSVIVAGKNNYEEALELSKLLNNALVSVQETQSDDSSIIIYLGEETGSN